MPTVHVDKLPFDFDAAWAADKYDEWDHYTQVFNKPPASQKAMDVVAVETSSDPQVTWLIEAKDFRVITNPPKPSNIGGLAQTVTDKVIDTLTGLSDARAHAITPKEKQLATLALTSASRRVVLHLEPHTGPHSALFPAGFAANVLQQLRRLVRHIDPNALVLNIANTPASGVSWTVL